MRLIEHIQHFSIEQYIYALSFVFIMLDSIGLQTRVKRILKLKVSKQYKIIDCFPCISFWLALLITFNLPVAFAIFLTAKFYEAIRFN